MAKLTSALKVEFVTTTQYPTMTITDPQDLWYISDVVNQVLDEKHELTDIKDVQAALKEVSIARGREIQMNLVFEEDKLKGFNFAFKQDPNNATPTICFKPTQLEMEVSEGNITPYKERISTIDVAQVETRGHLTTYSSSHGEIVVSPPLQVDNLHVIQPETTDVLVGTCNQFNKINPGLVRVAHQLASRNEIDGLLLTGVTLKAGVTLASSLQSEDNPDMHTAGLMVIKRFQQVLPQEFIDLKAGEIPKVFSWNDSKSGKQYCFKFSGCCFDNHNEAIQPVKLQGFETKPGSNLIRPVFAATLIDSKYNQWSIEQCDFTSSQVRDLSIAVKPTLSNLSPVIANAGGDSFLDIEY